MNAQTPPDSNPSGPTRFPIQLIGNVPTGEIILVFFSCFLTPGLAFANPALIGQSQMSVWKFWNWSLPIPDAIPFMTDQMSRHNSGIDLFLASEGPHVLWTTATFASLMRHARTIDQSVRINSSENNDTGLHRASLLLDTRRGGFRQ